MGLPGRLFPARGLRAWAFFPWAGWPMREGVSLARAAAIAKHKECQGGCSALCCVLPRPSLVPCLPHNPCSSPSRPRHDGYFVDLFVRVSNAVAINMYTKVLLQCPFGLLVGWGLRGPDHSREGVCAWDVWAGTGKCRGGRALLVQSRGAASPGCHWWRQGDGRGAAPPCRSAGVL